MASGHIIIDLSLGMLGTDVKTNVAFATTTLARLPKLSAWWIRLGILPELT